MRLDPIALFIAFNLGLLITLGLRGIWQRQFGASSAYGLWMLAPIFALATTLPVGGDEFAPVRQLLLPAAPTLTTVPVLLPESAQVNLWMSAWLLGCLLVAAYFLLANWRLRRHWANATIEGDARCPSLRIARVDFGPALVGVWAPLLLLPKDFEQRFDRTQQALVLAHESVHAKAADLPVRLFALLLSIAQWWNPLAWLALRKLIEDQELRCDAVVLSRHPGAQGAYARALAACEFSAAHSTSLVCSMHQRHPLIRRIAMLNRPAPSSRTRKIGALLSFICAALVAVVGWAAPDATPQLKSGAQNDFWVQFELQVDGRRTLKSSMGNRAGDTIFLHTSTPQGKLEVEAVLSKTGAPGLVMLNMLIKRDGVEIAKPALQMKLGAPGGRIEIGEDRTEGFAGIGLDATVELWNDRIDIPKSSTTARAVAAEVARQTGWNITGIELLSDQVIDVKFDAIAAESVLHLLADTSGLRVARAGNSARFEKP